MEDQIKKQPISLIQWVDVNRLRANAYNPNVVLSPEMKLLKYSLLAQGWIQPILVNQGESDGSDLLEVIDGYHRYTLCKTDGEVNRLTGGLVPVVIMRMPKSERMLLTIRINRAKGNHQAFKMHDIVEELHLVHGVSVADICTGIGAEQHEVNTLLAENVFVAKDVANSPYSKSWIPSRMKKEV